MVIIDGTQLPYHVFCTLDGTKIAKATTIDILLREDFDLLINSRKFEVKPPTVGMYNHVYLR